MSADIPTHGRALLRILTPRLASTMSSPRFWATPLRYLKWSARERPAYFWSLVIGAVGPISIPFTLKIRQLVGDEDAPKIPVTYPGRLQLRTPFVA